MMTLAASRAALIMEMAQLEQEHFEAAGTPAAPTKHELELEALREERRAEERASWNRYLMKLAGWHALQYPFSERRIGYEP